MMKGVSIEEKYKEKKKMAYSSLHSSSNTYYCHWYYSL